MTAAKQAQVHQRFDHKLLTIASVAPNPWNYNEQEPKTYAAERASIRDFGFIEAVTVRRLPAPRSDGVTHEIVNGEHRWRALKDEGSTELMVNDLGVLSDHDAQRLAIVLNETRGKPNTVRLGALVAELAKVTPIEELSITLPYSPEQLEGLCSLASFKWEQYGESQGPTPPAAPGAVTGTPPAAGTEVTKLPAAPPPGPAAPPQPQSLVLVIPAPAHADAARYLQVAAELYPGLTEAELVCEALRRLAQGGEPPQRTAAKAKATKGKRSKA